MGANEGRAHLDHIADAARVQRDRDMAAEAALHCTICGRRSTESPHTNPIVFGAEYHRFTPPIMTAEPLRTPPAVRQLTRSDCEFSYTTREHDAPPMPSGIGKLLDAHEKALIAKAYNGGDFRAHDEAVATTRAAVEAEYERAVDAGEEARALLTRERGEAFDARVAHELRVATMEAQLAELTEAALVFVKKYDAAPDGEPLYRTVGLTNGDFFTLKAALGEAIL